MHLSPDEIIYWQYGVIKMSATLVFTWVIMAILVVSAYFITRNLNKKNHRSRWQNALEIIVITINDQISDAGLDKPRRYMGFLGTLFLFIAMANLLTIFPGFEPPSSSLFVFFTCFRFGHSVCLSGSFSVGLHVDGRAMHCCILFANPIPRNKAA